MGRHESYSRPSGRDEKPRGAVIACPATYWRRWSPPTTGRVRSARGLSAVGASPRFGRVRRVVAPKPQSWDEAGDHGADRPFCPDLSDAPQLWTDALSRVARRSRTWSRQPDDFGSARLSTSLRTLRRCERLTTNRDARAASAPWHSAGARRPCPRVRSARPAAMPVTERRGVRRPPKRGDPSTVIVLDGAVALSHRFTIVARQALPKTPPESGPLRLRVRSSTASSRHPCS